jgi:hypothetical protein
VGHQRSGHRDVAEAGEPSQLGVAREGQEPRALHADQRVGGPLHEQDRAGDPLQPSWAIDHGRLDRLQVPRRLGEVQQQLTGIGGRQLPGTAPAPWQAQRPPDPGGGHWAGDGASSLARARPSAAPPPGGPAPMGCRARRGQSRSPTGPGPGWPAPGRPGHQGNSQRRGTGPPQPVQLAFEGIGQRGRCRRDPWGEWG